MMMSKPFLIGILAGSALALASCVTINVYFPAAAAERAAQEFVGKVIGEAPPRPQAVPNPVASHRPC